MKNTLFIASIISVFAFNAFAEDKIDTILHARPGGLIGRSTDLVESALGSRHGERIVVKNCAAAVAYLNTTDVPTIAVGYSDMMVDSDTNPCAVDSDNFYGYLAAAPMSLCTRTENADKAIDLINSGIQINIAYANYPWISLMINNLIEESGINALAVPYKSSKTYRAALAIGEVDFMISSFQGDGESCPIVLDNVLSGDATVLGKDLFPNSPTASDFLYSTYLFGANIDHNKELVDMIHSSDAFKNRTDQKYTPYMTDSSLTDQFNHISQ
jgi:hypothetical protein